jgi:hypothetical protein
MYTIMEYFSEEVVRVCKDLQHPVGRPLGNVVY